MSQQKNKDSIKGNINVRQLIYRVFGTTNKLQKALQPFLLKCIVLICIIIFATWGCKKIWYSVTDLSVFKISPSTFSFHVPSWMTSRFSDDIKDLSALNTHYRMYENNLTHKIASIYEEIILVKKVESIKRIFPNKINIKFVLRKPVVLVKSKNNSYLLDDECVLLPMEYYTLPNKEYDSPYITSSKLSKIPLYGSKWNDKRIEAGILLVKFLRENNIHTILNIICVDVSNVCKRSNSGKSDIVLRTKNNTQILWGCSPLCNKFKELSDEEKLQNLLSIAKSEGIHLRRMKSIDVRWNKPSGKRWQNPVMEDE
ncbi:MAG: hypothetical protein MRJ65_11345 [Candidatus Brocadiaceae bacterium]|nr:hypothetical protein [Candidatus Brocadiaceae bacterium]